MYHGPPKPLAPPPGTVLPEPIVMSQSSLTHTFTRTLAPLALAAGCTFSLSVQAETWLVISGASHHFRQEERDWREVNPGLGLEWSAKRPDWKSLYYVAGYFKNSYDKHALHAGVRWMPWEWKAFRFGGYGLLSTGYPSAVLLLPGFSVETRHVGINVVLAPNIGDYSGYVGVQARIRID